MNRTSSKTYPLGRYTPEAEAARKKALDDGLFRPKEDSYRNRIECTVCGAAGLPGGSWMDAHIKGHPDECPKCGKRLTKSTLGRHMRTRGH